MRVFIAVDINQQIKEAIGRLQEQLRKKTGIGKGQASWVRPDAMHLTLKFLGEIDDEQLTQVCKTVEEIAKGHKSFELNVESVGFFGGRAAKVLWVGSGAGSEKLCALAKEIDERLAQAGFAKEDREFAAHLTLCRIKDIAAGKSLAEAAGRFGDFKAGTVLIEKVLVYQSQLTPTGPIYTALGSYRLG
jgi:RNA 2',3'-cyclic 3'-phosphodiesterase